MKIKNKENISFLLWEKGSIVPIGHLSKLTLEIHLRSWNQHWHKIGNWHWHRQTEINNNRHRYQHRPKKWNQHITTHDLW